MFSYSREIQKVIGDAKQGVKSSPRQRTRILLRKTRRIHMNVQEIVTTDTVRALHSAPTKRFITRCLR